MNPYSPPTTPPAKKTLAETRTLYRTLNPARYQLWPIGILSVLASLVAFPRGGPVFFPTLAVCILISSFGAVALALAGSTYTSTNRRLTILWTIIAMCGMFVTLTLDPPSGSFDTLLAVATVLVLLSVGVLAAFYLPNTSADSGENGNPPVIRQ